MEHYLAYTDYPIWEVIQNGNGPVSITTDTQGQIKVLPLKTTEEILARERERKARTTLLMALPEDHLAKFHKMTDAKEMWEAIRSRFRGNDESKKISLPFAWSQVSLIMRTKPGVDSLSFDDLYNNLRVFENDVKGSTASSSSTQNVAFVSENTSSTNNVSTAYGVSNPSDLEQLNEFDLEEIDLKWQVAMISMRMKKFYKKTGRKLQFDAKEPVSFDKTKVECYNCHKTGHFARECKTKGNQDIKRRDAWNSGNKDGRRSGKQEDSKALATIDGEGSDTEVISCSKECKESYVELKKLYDKQRAQLSDASIEILSYTQALKIVESQLVAHQQGQLWYEEKIRFMKIDLDDKTDVLTYHKKLLAEAEKEKEELKAKVEKWHNSSKNLSKLVNTQMSANDKFGLGVETSEFVTETVVNEPKVVSQPKVWSDAPIIEEYESDSEDEHVSQPTKEQETPSFANQQVKTPRETVKNQFTHSKNPKVDKKGLGYGFATKACFVCGSLSHLIRDCDFHEKRMAKQVELNKQKGKGSSQREIRPVWNNVQRVNHKNQFVPTAVLTRTGKIPVSTARASGTNNVSTARHNFNSQAVLTNAARKISTVKPFVNRYESDSEDEHVSQPTEEQETPSFANQQVKTPRETVKNQFTHSKNPKVDKKGLGYGFTTKACFVCGSLSHLIRDCDFHEKKMAQQAELNNRMRKKSSQREIRPIWNNVQRTNLFLQHQAVLTNAARKISTVKPFVNRVRPKTIFHKTHSPFRRPFNNTTALRTNFSKQKVNTTKVNAVSPVRGKGKLLLSPQQDYPHKTFRNKGIVDSGCSRHMSGNKAYLAEYQDFNGGPVAFGGSKGYITGKGKIKTGKLDFEDVCFVKELHHFNLFSVSQMCDNKYKVLFTDTECLVLSPEFKLPDENQVLLRIPRQNNMYSFNLENIVPFGGLACLIAKATIDESNKWHRRLGHVNFKNLNKLVKGNLVRGLPSKIFQNDHTCVACQKGKQHKASCKAKSVSSISQPLQLLHMDLFGPTSVRSLNHKTYCLVITDDFSRFSWVFFLRTKDETSGILKDFIRQIENQLNQKVKTIRCDNGTEFKNRDFIEFCGSKGIKREYSNARTPQQNGVAERKNRTLIEAARTMLADSFLPNTFWAEAVSTACYVLNRVLVTKPQNKTPYELITGKIPIISYIRPFGCHVTILNTIDHLGKFDGKSDEGFLVGYSLQSKAFRVYNLETKRVEENLHITFLENKPNVAGKGPSRRVLGLCLLYKLFPSCVAT
ncbi:putative ribonuclease H-like domain-containing protein [Tanacetum coccineum]